jgi:hypothetical protein
MAAYRAKGKFCDDLSAPSNQRLKRRKTLPHIEASECSFSMDARTAGNGQAKSEVHCQVVAASCLICLQKADIQSRNSRTMSVRSSLDLYV